ncbi:unnamed protein product [Pocillopora meandrina]|uniref:CCHC-type domain-containing protein n=1 Tax=Pocillopora meandrina TaxID=46732 RepID=A0AAU9XGP7_9CNID|nr:unnamed protein product [Pocillopora meandrina]
MACLRALLSPAIRAVYKYSLWLSAEDLAKPHLVINALTEYYGASIGVSRTNRSALRNRVYEIKLHSANMRITSETLRVKLTGKGQRHRDAAAIPVLVNIAFGKRCNKCGIVGHFARACKGGTGKQAGNKQQSNFVDDDADEEAFVAECKASHKPAKKFFAHLHLVHDGKSKIVRAQIDSASTCNTMPSNLLSQLFPNLKVSKTRSRISTYGSQKMRPKGQVTLVCDRSRLETIDFLAVDVPGDKPSLLSGKDAQALKYLKIYADERNAVEDEIPQTPQTLPPLGMLMAEDILRQYANVSRPWRGKPLGTLMHIQLDSSVTPVSCPNTPSACGRVRPGK